jgi:hypothetical protein
MASVEYLAGFFDGEGCIGIRKPSLHGVRSDLYALWIGVSNTDPRPLQYFVKAFGGSVRGPYHGKRNHKPIYQWKVCSRQAENSLRAMLPYLIVKKDRAEIGIAHRELFKGNNILRHGPNADKEKRNFVLAMRASMYQQMHKLNARGN